MSIRRFLSRFDSYRSGLGSLILFVGKITRSVVELPPPILRSLAILGTDVPSFGLRCLLVHPRE